MRIIKYTHACVRIEHDGGVLVIDPGVWSEPRALAGADAVIVTHEHGDHIDVLRLAGLGVPVFAPADARIGGLDVTGVRPGQRFTAAGLSVRAVGGRHATIYNGQPDCANLGYLVEDAIYHPGDALYVPETPVETLFVPMQGSWLKTSEAIEFARAVGAARAFPIHEGQLNSRGLVSVDGWFGEQIDGYRYLAPGDAA